MKGCENNIIIFISTGRAGTSYVTNQLEYLGMNISHQDEKSKIINVIGNFFFEMKKFRN